MASYLDGDANEAGRLCQEILRYEATNVRAMHLYAVTEMCLGRSNSAIRKLRELVRLDSESAEINATLGVAFRRLGRLPEARSCLELALRMEPESPQFWNNLGLVHKDSKDTRNAIACFEKALSLNPRHVCAVFNLANLRCTEGRLAESLELLRTVHEFGQCIPQICERIVALLIDLDRLDEAESHARDSVRMHPGSAPSWQLLGRVLERTGGLEESIQSFRVAIEIDPSSQAGRIEIARDSSSRGAFADAVDHLRVLCDSDDADGATLMLLGHVLHQLGSLEDGIEQFHAAVVAGCAELALESIAMLIPHSQRADLDRVRKLRHAWAERYLPDMPSLPQYSATHRKIRVAYLCGLDAQSVEFEAFQQIAAAHNFDEFDIQVLVDRSNLQAELRELTPTAVVDISRWSNDSLSGYCGQNRFDLLVNLHLESKPIRHRFLATVPTGAVISWLGVTGTSANPRIRHLIADRCLIAPGEDAAYSEQVWRLPFSTISVINSAEPIADSVAQSDAVRLGAYCRLSQLGTTLVSAWSRILKSVSVELWICCPEFAHACNREWLLDRFREHSIADETIRLSTPDSSGSRFSFFHNIDLALDTFPTSMGFDCLDALWQGVPVVSLHGRCMPGRTASTVLQANGLSRFVADSPGDYCDKVVRLIAESDPTTRLREIGSEILQATQCGPIADVTALARSLESILKAISENQQSNGAS